VRKTVLADTSPLYAALDPSDNNHDRAREDIEYLNAEGIGVMVGNTTLCECYSLILYKLGIRAAHSWLRDLRDHATLVNPTPEDFEEAADLVRSYQDQALSMFDAVTAALSRRLGLPVWTYDHHCDVMRVEVWRDA
jgi:predicted nucleic acid-binding protein